MNELEAPGQDHATESPEKGVSDGQLQDFLTKLILRIFESSPLVAGYLAKQYCGKGVIELVFYKLPDNVLLQLVNTFGSCPYEQFSFDLDGEPVNAFRLKPGPNDVSDLLVVEPGCDNADPQRLCNNDTPQDDKSAASATQ